MALTDKFTEMDTALAVTATAISTNVIDLAANQDFRSYRRDIGRGATLYVKLNVTEAFVSAGGATLSVGMVLDDTVTLLGTPYIIFTSGLLAVSQLALGAEYTWPIPDLSNSLTASQTPVRYFGLYYVVATSTFSAGKLTTSWSMQSGGKKPVMSTIGYSGP
jgi:hypothetical protein